jgi:hypothetical protein
VPALPAVAQIPVLSSTQRGALHKDILQVAEKDYLYMLRSIAAQEIAGQVQMGNQPTGMLVDGRKAKPIEDATRSVRVWFADRRALLNATRAARDALIANGRIVTGHTVDKIRCYYSVGRGGAVRPASPEIALTFPNPAALDLWVSLPVVHVRRWQWLGKSGKRLMRASRDRKRRYNPGVGGARMVSRSVFEQSAQQVQRRFPSLDVSDEYLQVSNLNIGGRTAVDRIPAIKVCMKRRGRGR